jgi:hypothetical protein
MSKKRREDRNLCADLIQISWRLEDHSRHSEWATLEDISSSGACVKLDDTIPPETPVFLRFPKGSCNARVKYCVADHGGYLVGVEFESGYRWSRSKFRPDHLIQFRLRPASERE